MVYNADSVWLHLFVAYTKMVVDGEFEGLEIREAFSRTTDGPDCPIARCYTPTEWISICGEAGFDCEFVGGYPTTVDLDLSERYAAIASDALGEEHRAFLRDLEVDANGHPTWRGKHAGVGGVYHFAQATPFAVAPRQHARRPPRPVGLKGFSHRLIEEAEVRAAGVPHTSGFLLLEECSGGWARTDRPSG